jgi:hypothetical protein
LIISICNGYGLFCSTKFYFTADGIGNPAEVTTLSQKYPFKNAAWKAKRFTGSLFPVHREESHTVAAMDFQREECSRILTVNLKFASHTTSYVVIILI